MREQRTTNSSSDPTDETDHPTDVPTDDGGEPSVDADEEEKQPVDVAEAVEMADDGPGNEAPVRDESGDGDSDDGGDEQQTSQIIEFELGEDRYGVDITRADEVLAYREVTRVPNTPDLIRGVVDIRGQIITVIDPTTVFDPRGTADAEGLIVVFEVELLDGPELIGWAVDNVLSVHTVRESEIVEPPSQGSTVEAALEREDGYLTLTTPESLLATTGEFRNKLAETSESELEARA
jgi:purine-binding chemotaxis protein CheW